MFQIVEFFTGDTQQVFVAHTFELLGAINVHVYLRCVVWCSQTVQLDQRIGGVLHFGRSRWGAISLHIHPGTDKSKLLTATIWLADMADFAGLNSVWDKWVVPGATPTRTCVESKIAAPQFTVEIAITAVVE